jgi:hypothetical protein
MQLPKLDGQGKGMLKLPWGTTSVSISLPPAWHVAPVLASLGISPAADPAAEVARSLASPIGPNRKFPFGRGALRLLAPLLLPLVPRLKVAGMGEEDRFFLSFALQSMRHAHVFLYAPPIPPEIQARMPFVRFVADVQEAITAASRVFPGKAEVLVFPSGGITYPEMGAAG